MAPEREMTAPVTRGELHEALETWAGAINARTDAKFAALETKFDAKFDAFAYEMRTLVKNFAESLLDRMNALWEPLRSLPARVGQLEELPARVSKLEAHVFAPKSRTRRARRTAGAGRATARRKRPR